MKCLPCKPVDIINLYPSPHCKLKGVTTHHPDRFRKHWPQGRYLLVTASHVAAVVDGEMHDWARNHSIRVTSIYDVRNQTDGEEPKGAAMIKYPNIKVRLIGTDGNAFAIVGTVRAALKRNGVSKEEVDEFSREATSGGYDHLLQTCMKWVDVS